MTYTVIISDVSSESDAEWYADFASGLGVQEFRESLTPQMPELAHLLDYGWSDNLDSITSELEALQSISSDNVGKSAGLILAAIEESGLNEAVLSLTNGVANDESEEEPIKSLGDPEAVMEMLLEAVASLGDRRPTVEAVADQVEALVLTFLGENPKYEAVEDWNTPGKIDQFLAESEDIDNADPKERLRLFVSGILKEAVEQVHTRSSGYRLQETLETAAELLTGQNISDEQGRNAVEKSLTKTQEYLSREWDDYP